MVLAACSCISNNILHSAWRRITNNETLSSLHFPHLPCPGWSTEHMATAEGQPNGTEGYARITSHRTVHVRKLNREMATYIYSKVVRSTCDVTTFPTLLLFPTPPLFPLEGGCHFLYFLLFLLRKFISEDTQYVNGTESFKFHKLELLLLQLLLFLPC